MKQAGARIVGLTLVREVFQCWDVTAITVAADHAVFCEGGLGKFSDGSLLDTDTAHFSDGIHADFRILGKRTPLSTVGLPDIPGTPPPLRIALEMLPAVFLLKLLSRRNGVFPKLVVKDEKE